jgi:hypothetical protein
MAAQKRCMITIDDEVLSYDRTDRLAHHIHNQRDDGIVIIDLARVNETTTAAFARLLLMRRELLARNRDLRLANLRGRARHLYRVLRIAPALPLC